MTFLVTALILFLVVLGLTALGTDLTAGRR